ncbi:glycoside hydrolase family 26 protein [Sphingobacterium bambusae]|uniref:Glycoside hydrolase family 26 protein n=1 Tax=Sphingobacterium bambusae TaxID=662858 RepID=A0ABW6BE24_9SPHI|nr:glycosyl hydrolase [Sphingobacterium bambusae]WPL46889.1 glycosyl hydrolase [Sphingobacterium bambusae]
MKNNNLFDEAPIESWKYPSNSYVNNSTRRLFHNLNKIGQSSQVILGHQSTNTLSRNGQIEITDSDIKEVTGQFPGLVAYDLGWIERKKGNVWLDGSVDKLIKSIQYCRKLGIPVSLSWHTRNPTDVQYDQKNRALNGKVKNIQNTVGQILSDETVQQTYISWLDILAEFFGKLVDETGEVIPILFRPFHECSGNWFWWGNGQCTDEEYIKLFQFTHEYLTKTKMVDNLLWIYNTDKVRTEAEYMKRYPGDQYVDFCSIDFYDYENYSIDKFKSLLTKSLDVLRACSKRQNKGYLIAEGGKKNYQDQNYFTSRCINFFPKDLIYFCFWANSKKNYYTTSQRDQNKEDFKVMVKENKLLLQKEVLKLKLFS